MSVCSKCERDTPAFCDEKHCPLALAPSVSPSLIRVEHNGDLIALHIRGLGSFLLTPENAWRIGRELASAAISDHPFSSVLADQERSVG